MNAFISILTVFTLVGYITLFVSRYAPEMRMLSAVINVSCLSVCTGALSNGWAAPEQVSTVLFVLLFHNTLLLRHLPWRAVNQNS